MWILLAWNSFLTNFPYIRSISCISLWHALLRVTWIHILLLVLCVNESSWATWSWHVLILHRRLVVMWHFTPYTLSIHHNYSRLPYLRTLLLVSLSLSIHVRHGRAIILILWYILGNCCIRKYTTWSTSIPIQWLEAWSILLRPQMHEIVLQANRALLILTIELLFFHLIQRIMHSLSTSRLVSIHATSYIWNWPHRVRPFAWRAHSRVCAHLRVMSAARYSAHSAWTCCHSWHHTHRLPSRWSVFIFFNSAVLWLPSSLALPHKTKLIIIFFLFQRNVLPFKSLKIPEASSCRWINHTTMSIKWILCTLEVALVVCLVLRVRQFLYIWLKLLQQD